MKLRGLAIFIFLCLALPTSTAAGENQGKNIEYTYKDVIITYPYGWATIACEGADQLILRNPGLQHILLLNYIRDQRSGLGGAGIHTSPAHMDLIKALATPFQGETGRLLNRDTRDTQPDQNGYSEAYHASGTFFGSHVEMLVVVEAGFTVTLIDVGDPAPALSERNFIVEHMRSTDPQLDKALNRIRYISINK